MAEDIRCVDHFVCPLLFVYFMVHPSVCDCPADFKSGKYLYLILPRGLEMCVAWCYIIADSEPADTQEAWLWQSKSI